jgi:hypothetical protein
MGQVLQPVGAEVTHSEVRGQIGLDQSPRGVGDQDLSTVPGGADPSCPVNVDADVIAGHDVALSGMQTHPDPHRLRKRMIGQGPLDLSSGLNRFQGAREHDEEGIPLGADLGSIVFLDYVSQDAVMALKEIDVAVP